MSLGNCLAVARHSDEYGCAAAGRGLNIERSAQECYPLTHAEQTKFLVVPSRLDLETYAIVFDDGDTLAGAPFDDDTGPRRLGVAHHVGQRLLDDSVERRFHFGWQALISQADSGQIDLQPALSCQRFAVLLQRRQQA